MAAPVSPAEIIALAQEVGAQAQTPFIELVPAGTIRTFRVGDTVVRFDHTAGGTGLNAAAQAMKTLRRAVSPPIVPELCGSGKAKLGGIVRPWLATRWLDGPTLTRAQAQDRPQAIGNLLADLHGARIFDLLFRFACQRPMTLMESFKLLSGQLRRWLLAREADGLSQDLLTLTLSDLQRAMRQYAMVQDHHFRTAQRRVLLHGRPRPSAIVATGGGAHALVNFESACLGDGAEDAAALCLAARFDDVQESDFLAAYLQRLKDQGREDPRFLLRFFPRRFLLQLQEPIAALDQMLRIRRGDAEVVTDQVAALEELMESTTQSLTDAMNGLRGFVGGMREITVREVKGMGRLLSYEELLLRDRTFRLVITGLPYAGKTEVGSALARRLAHDYFNTSVFARAVAAFSILLPHKEEGGGRDVMADDDTIDNRPDEQRQQTDAEQDAPSVSLADRVRALFDAGFKIEASDEPPFYIASIHGRDVTDLLRSDEVTLRGATTLDDESVRLALRDEIAHHFAARGVVIEGAYAQELAPGRTRNFHLISDPAVRCARLMSHRFDIESEDEAETLLQQLDDAAAGIPEAATAVDVGARPAGAAALAVLWHLLPASRRPNLKDYPLGGRAPLYS